MLGEGEIRFVENNMSRNNDFTTRDIIAFVPPMIRRIPKENTWNRSSLEFVYSRRWKEGKTKTTKDTEMVISWKSMVEIVSRGGKLKYF